MTMQKVDSAEVNVSRQRGNAAPRDAESRCFNSPTVAKTVSSPAEMCEEHALGVATEQSAQGGMMSFQTVVLVLSFSVALQLPRFCLQCCPVPCCTLTRTLTFVTESPSRIWLFWLGYNTLVGSRTERAG